MNMRLRRGFGQLEVVVSTILVGVLMVSSFSSIAASRRSQTFESNKVRGLAIAEALLAEICQLPMRDPINTDSFGTAADERGTSRIKFDDVDDYHNLVDEPPKSKSGVAYTSCSDLSRRVIIDRVKSSDWNSTTSSYEGVYRITVRVLRGSREICRIVGYRAEGSFGASSVANATSIL